MTTLYLDPSFYHPISADNNVVSVTEGTGWQRATLKDGDAINVYRPTMAEVVAKVRKLQASIRTMHRNVRLGRYEGRNRGGDTSFLQTQLDAIFPTLTHRLQGFLTHEHKLADRISENRDLGNERPELQNRIRVLRNAIKTEVGSYDHR